MPVHTHLPKMLTIAMILIGAISLLKNHVTYPMASAYFPPIPISPSATLELAPESTYEIGLKLYEAGRYSAAQHQFSLAIRQQIDFVDAYLMRGKTYAAQQELTLAVADYTVVLQAEPTYTEVYKLRAAALIALGNIGAAVTDLSQAIELDATSDLYLVRGKLYLEIAEYEAALNDFNLAIEQNPGLFESYYWRGRVYIELDNVDAALADLQHYLNSTPDNDPLREEASTLLSELSPPE